MNRKAKNSKTKIPSPNSTLNIQNSKLPKGWVWVRLGEIVKIVYGKDLSVKQFKKSGYPVFGANGVIGFYDKYLYEEEQVLISCRGAYSGKINLSPPKSFITHNSLILKINENFRLLKKFLFYILQSVDKSKLVTGTAQPQVTINNAINIELPLPPLAEQHRIVAKVEEIFTKLDAGVDALKKAKEQIKRYRQAVLKYAFEGKLTEEWRKSFELLMLNGELKETQNSTLNTQHSKLNIQHPKFSIQSSTFKTENSAFNTQNSPLTTQNSKLPRGWVWTRLDSCSELITKGESPKWQGFNYVEDGIPFIRSENVLWGKVDISNTVKIPIDFHNKLKRSQIKGYDILINLVGASIGRCGVVQPNINTANINQAVALIRTNNLLAPFYLMYLLLSPKFQQIIHSNKVETARPNISLEDLKTLILPLPSFPEQQKIVEEIERRFSVADEVEKAIDNSLKQAERLRQSILKKAFEGKLVPQDPNDEPADKLLERVRKSLQL